MVKDGPRYYTVTVPYDISMKVEKEAASAGIPALAYLALLVSWAMSGGPCPHPPAVVQDGGVPQCFGCGEFL